MTRGKIALQNGTAHCVMLNMGQQRALPDKNKWPLRRLGVRGLGRYLDRAPGRRPTGTLLPSPPPRGDCTLLTGHLMVPEYPSR